MNWMLAEARDGFDVETTATKGQVMSEDGILTHANCYLTHPALLDQDLGCSSCRIPTCGTIDASLLKKRLGSIDRLI
jgi:hypothetical protein